MCGGRDWRASGHLIGNHTYSHQPLYGDTMPGGANRGFRVPKQFLREHSSNRDSRDTAENPRTVPSNPMTTSPALRNNSALCPVRRTRHQHHALRPMYASRPPPRPRSPTSPTAVCSSGFRGSHSRAALRSVAGPARTATESLQTPPRRLTSLFPAFSRRTAFLPNKPGNL
jgi:hypothetical protein